MEVRGEDEEARSEKQEVGSKNWEVRSERWEEVVSWLGEGGCVMEMWQTDMGMSVWKK